MTERQTKENLKNIIEQEMASFGIDYKQVLAITSDNGQNMLATVLELKKCFGPAVTGSLAVMLEKENAFLGTLAADDELDSDTVETEKDEDEQEHCDDVPECDLKTEEETDDFTEAQEAGDTNDNVYDEDDDDCLFDDLLDILESVRCGAHTAQLAVWDVLRQYKTRMANINKKCLRMHHRKHRELFKFHKIALPPKVCETRWNVWYILLKYLKELEKSPMLGILKNSDPEIGKHSYFSYFNLYLAKRVMSNLFLFGAKMRQT